MIVFKGNSSFFDLSIPRFPNFRKFKYANSLEFRLFCSAKSSIERTELIKILQTKFEVEL